MAKVADKVAHAVLTGLKFVAISLAIDLGLLLVVFIWCLLGTHCTSDMYSNRMFWGGMIAIVAALPAVIAGLNSQRGYFNSPFTAGQDAKVYRTIIDDAHKQVDKMTIYFWRMATIGAGAIFISALIDIFTH